MDSFSVGIVQRNWGTYEVLFDGEGYRVKRLMIDPASALSNQYHNHRSEAWTVVNGEVILQLFHPDKDKHMYEIHLKEGESHTISIGTWHRAINPTDRTTEIVEVWIGNKLSEDDIIRAET